MVFLKDFLEKLILKKNPQTTKKHTKLPSMQRVKGSLIMQRNCKGGVFGDNFWCNFL